MSDLADVLDIDIRTTGIESLDRASRALDRLGLSANGLASNFASLVGGATVQMFDDVARAAELASIAVAGIGLKSLSLAGSFEANMNRVKFLTDSTGESADQTAARMQRIAVAAIQIGKETTFSSNEAAAGQAILAQQHYNTNQIIEMGLPIARAAMDNNLTMKDVTLTLTGVLNAFGMQSSDTTRVLDMMAQGTRMGRMTFQDFGAETSRVGAIAQRLGLSFEDVTAQMVALENNSTTARQSGMLLGSIYSQLLAPTAKQADLMKTLGITYRDASGQMKPYQDIVQNITDATKGMSNAQQDQIIKTLFLTNGTKVFDSILGAHYTVLENGKEVTYEGTKAIDKMSEAVHNSGGTLERASNIIMSGFNASMKNLAGSTREAGIAIGLHMLPAATEMVKTTIDTVNHFIDLELRTHAIGTAFTDLGIIIGAVFGPLATMVSDAAIRFEAFMLNTQGAADAMDNLKYVAGLLGQVIAGGLNVAITYMTSIWAALAPILYTTAFNLDLVLGHTANLSSAFTFLNSAAHLLGTAVGTVAGFVIALGGGILQFLMPAVNALNAEFLYGYGVGGALRDVLGQITQNAYPLGIAIGQLLVSVGQFFGVLIQLVDQTGLVQFAFDTLVSGLNLFTIVIQSITQAIQAHFTEISAVIEIWKNVVSTAFAVVSSVIATVTTFITNNFGLIASIVGNAGFEIEAALNGIGKVVTAITPFVVNFVGVALFGLNNALVALTAILNIVYPILAFFGGIISALSPILIPIIATITIFNGAAVLLGVAIGGVTTAVGLLTAALDFMLGPLGAVLLGVLLGIAIYENFGTVVEIVSNGIGDAWVAMENMFIGLVNIMIDGLNMIIGAWNSVSSMIGGSAIPAIQRWTQATITHTHSTADLANQLHFTIPGIDALKNAAYGAAGGINAAAGSASAAIGPILALGSAAMAAAAQVAYLMMVTAAARASAQYVPGESLGYQVGIGHSPSPAAPIYVPPVIPAFTGGGGGIPGGGGGGGGGAPKGGGGGGGGGAAPKDPLQEALDLADKLAKAAEALSKVNQYYTVSAVALKAFNDDMTKLIEDFVAGATKFGTQGIDGAGKYADAAGKIADATSKMADALNKVRDWQMLGAVAIANFIYDNERMVKSYVDASALFTVAMYQGALYFAETSAHVADAAGKMADALNKVRGWAGVALVSIEGFVYDVTLLIAQYYTLSLHYTNKMQDGMKLFSDTAVKVADAMGKMADALNKVRDWSGVALVSIVGFTYNVDLLIREFEKYSESYTTAMLSGASRFADTSTKVADATAKMADALKKVLNWVGVAVVSIEGFVYNVDLLVNEYRKASEHYTEDMLMSTDKFVKTSDGVSTDAVKMADALAKVRDYSVVDGAAIALFGINVMQLINAYAMYAGNYTTGMLDATSAYAKTSDTVATAAAKYMGVFAQFPNYAVVAGDAIALFGLNVKQMTDAFNYNASTYTAEMITAIGTYGEAAGKVVTAMGSAISVFTNLRKFRGVAPEAIQGIIDDMVLTVSRIDTMVTDAQLKMLPKAGVFGEMSKKLFDGLESAMKWFQDMTKFVGIAPAVIQLFVDDVLLVVDKVTALTILADTVLIGQITAFGDATNKLFAGLKAAMDTFSGLKDYKSVPPKVIDDFIWSISTTIDKVAALNDATMQTLLPQAGEFADYVTQIFTALKNALTLFDDLSKVKDSPVNAINELIKALGNALTALGALNAKADEYLVQAQKFQKTMEDALAAIIAGMDAKSKAEAAGGMPSGPAFPGSGTPPPGATTSQVGALAAGGTAEGNKPYKVGEFGPEWFIPKGAGTMIDARNSRDLDGGNSGKSIYVTYRIDNMQFIVDGGNTPQQTAEDVQNALYELFKNGKQLSVIGGMQ